MRDRVKRFFGSPTMNLVIVILVVASTTIGIQAILSRRDLAHCIADWGDRDAVATAERARAADMDRDLDKADRAASLAFYRSLRADGVSPAQREQAFNTWVNTLEANEVKRGQNDEIRAKNPTPARPSLSCE
jgi:hypothetical protein